MLKRSGSVAVNENGRGNVVIVNIDPSAINTMLQGGSITLKDIPGMSDKLFYFVSKKTPEEFQVFLNEAEKGT